jgi:hypothetical protein
MIFVMRRLVRLRGHLNVTLIRLDDCVGFISGGADGDRDFLRLPSSFAGEESGDSVGAERPRVSQDIVQECSANIA